MQEQKHVPEISLKQLFLALTCLAVAIAIVVHDVNTGAHADGSRVSPPVRFVLTRPHFFAALFAAYGAITGQFWMMLVFGFIISTIAIVFAVLFLSRLC